MLFHLRYIGGSYVSDRVDTFQPGSRLAVRTRYIVGSAVLQKNMCYCDRQALFVSGTT